MIIPALGGVSRHKGPPSWGYTRGFMRMLQKVVKREIYSFVHRKRALHKTVVLVQHCFL